MRSRSWYVPAWNEPAPRHASPTPGTRATSRSRPCCELVADLLRAPPVLDLDRHRRAVTPGWVELPEEPAADDHERQDEEGEHAEDRPGAAPAAGPVGVDPGPWPPRRRTTSDPAAPCRTDSARRIGGSANPVTESAGESVGFGEPGPNRPANRWIRRPGRRIGRRTRSDSANPGTERWAIGPTGFRRGRVLGPAEPGSSWPPSSVGVTRAARPAALEPGLQDHRGGRGVDVVALGALPRRCAGASHRGGCAGRSSW